MNNNKVPLSSIYISLNKKENVISLLFSQNEVDFYFNYRIDMIGENLLWI